MSNQNHNPSFPARVPLFLFLLGTLAFSLSTLPSGKDSGHFMVTSLSSEFASDCDSMGQNINRGANSGSCVINPVSTKGEMAKVSGRVNVELVDVNRRDPHDVNKVVTRKEWQRTTEIVCEGKDCPAEPIKIQKNYDQNDYMKLSRMDDFESGAQKMLALMKRAKAEADKEREEQDKRYRCEVNRDGRKLNDKEQLSCRIARVEKMGEDEAAADYYEQYVLPKIQTMLASGDIRKQRMGMDMLRQLSNSGGGGDFVQESVRDLARFGQFKYQADQQKLQILAMNPKDPRRPALIEQMRVSQFQADMYFRSRGLQVQNDDWTPGANGFDFSSVLLDNLSGFQNRIDQTYAAILQQHQNLLNPNFQPQVQQQQQMANAWNPTAQQQWQQNGNYPPVPPQSNQQQQNLQQAMQPQQAQAAGNPVPPVTQIQAQKSNVQLKRSVTKR